MLTFSRRRFGSASALAMALVAGLPALAQAQLFPNLFVQRERTPCAAEPPFYGHVRRDYYGYYPTCWKRFPDGRTERLACIPGHKPEALAVAPDEKSVRVISEDDDYGGRPIRVTAVHLAL